jgi:hypothetical protein
VKSLLAKQCGTDMATILPFVGRRPDRARRQKGATGEIVIFPGVRIEYHDHAPAPAVSRAQRTKQRRDKDALSS